MKDPRPVNLMTTDEVRKLGWMMESRDGDGHLVSMLSPNVSKKDVAKFVAEEQAAGNTVTMIGKRKN